MSAVLSPVPAAAAKTVAMTVLIVGKVEAVRRYENKVYTRVICAAPDLYSRPSVVEIRSNARMGQRDEEINVQARLGGFTRKPYRVTDRESGEQANITPVDHTLDLLE